MERVIILEKEKTALVVTEKQDIDIWYKGINDLEINQFITTYGNVLFRENEEKFYENMTNDKNSRYFSIYSKISKKTIGNATLTNICFQRGICEIGITIFDKKSQNQGHGSDTMKMLLEFGFNILGLRKIRLRVFGNNNRAIHVYEKVGFKKVGTFQKEYFRNGEFVDENIMEIFREEFLEK